MRAALLIIFMCLSANCFATDYSIKVWSYTDEVTAAQVQKALDIAGAILTKDDSPGDKACPTNFTVKGAVFNGAGSTLPPLLTVAGDFVKYRSDRRFSLYIVRKIDFCGYAVTDHRQTFGGCTGQHADRC
ncbi:hypothetical protein [Devosia sp.]|uniref:hypothetical protein n=1 Tax=Devosia sp. TaxID=1871048 RepID=UPI0032658802